MHATPLFSRKNLADIHCPDCKSGSKDLEILIPIWTPVDQAANDPVKSIDPQGADWEFSEYQFHCNNCGENFYEGKFNWTTEKSQPKITEKSPSP